MIPTLVTCLIVATMAPTQEPGPAVLVELLGSNDRVKREEAARTLHELGLEALPSLHLAEKAGRDLTRSRARTVARAIEGRFLDRPGRVAVDFQGQPLDEVIRSLADRFGQPLKLQVGDDLALARRPVVARAPAPVTFWETLTLIGRSARIRHETEAWNWGLSRSTVLPLADGDPPGWTLDQGVFRIRLPGLHRRIDLPLSQAAGPTPGSTKVLYVDLEAFVEPGRFLDTDGVPRIEAIDDQGRPLAAPLADADWSRMNWFVTNSPGAIDRLQWRLPLGLPEPSATRLTRLKGTLPVLVSAVRPDPIVIALDDPPGQSYRHQDNTIRFKIIQDMPGRMQIELTAVREIDPAETTDQRGTAAYRHRFGFDDSEGRPLAWIASMEPVDSANQTRITFTVEGGERPRKLRVHDLTWTSSVISFEFTDVPLP